MVRRRVMVSLLSLAIGSIATSRLRADTVYLTGQEISNAQITRIENGQVYFVLAGREVAREVSRVIRLSVDNEPAFNAAEEAFAAGKFDDAAEGYQKAVRSARKEWIKSYASTRLLEAAGKSGRFDAAATAYIQLVIRDPKQAAQNRPTLPDEKSTYLQTAANDVETALKDAKLNDDQRLTLLTFLVDLHTARRDTKLIDAAATRLDEVLTRNPTHPNAGRALARRKLVNAANFLAAKNYDKAKSEIDSGKPAFTDLLQQAEAMWILAEVNFGLIDQSKTDATKTAALKDAAIAYLRIPAHFSGVPGKPRVAAALLKAAEISETIKESQTAMILYQQVQSEFADTESGVKAAAAVSRLKSAVKP